MLFNFLHMLAACRARVIDARCELNPSWAGGALLLFPATKEQVAYAGLQLQKHHILMLSSDKPLVEELLGQLPRRKRLFARLLPERPPSMPRRAHRRRHGMEQLLSGQFPSCLRQEALLKTEYGGKKQSITKKICL